MDYTLNIYKNNKFICTLGANHFYYDNVMWWKLDELIKECKEKDLTKSTISNICNKIGYLKVLDNELPLEESDYIDFGSKVIKMPTAPVFSFDEVEDNTPIKVIKKGNKCFSKYDDEEEYEMADVKFDDVGLFKKQTVSFDEFKKLCEFIDPLVISGETDYVLNKELVIRLSCI